MAELTQVPAFFADDSLACEPLRHGEDVAAHVHDFGQLRYAASGVLVTSTKAGTWMAPANRITWMPPFEVHASRSYGATDVRLASIPAPLSGQLPPEPGVFAASALLREAFLALASDGEPAGSRRARLLLEA